MMIDDYCSKHGFERSQIVTAAVEAFMGVGTDGQEGPHLWLKSANEMWPRW